MTEERWGNEGDMIDFSKPATNTTSFEQGRAPCRGKGRGTIPYNNNDRNYHVVGNNSYENEKTEYGENHGYRTGNGMFNNRRDGKSNDGFSHGYGGDGNNGDERRSYGNKNGMRNDSRRRDSNNDESWDNDVNNQNGRRDIPRRDNMKGGRDGGYGRNREDGDGYGRNREDDSSYGRNRKNDGSYSRSRENDGGGYSRNKENDGGYSRNGENNDGYGRNRKGDGGYGRNGEDDSDQFVRDNDNRDRGRRTNNDGFRKDNEEGQPKNREIYIPPEQSTDETALFGNDVSMGINFDKYDEIQVKVSGENAPQPMNFFDQAGLRSLLLDNIKKSGYKKPTPVQKYAIPMIMDGRDLMACAQTGSGKTAAFVVPIINTLLENPRDLVQTSYSCEPQVIIISPTRELTIQIFQQVLKFSLNSVLRTQLAYGGTSVSHQSNKVLGGCHILVATPGRLLDFLGKGKIKLSSLRFLVLDEADRMLDMGFLPDVEKLVDHETMVPPEERQTLMFSATFPPEIQELASRFLRNYLFLAVGIVGAACADVEQNFYQASGQSEKRKLLKELIEKQSLIGSIEGTLVFVEQKRHADFIAAFLSESNFPTTSIHGDRLQREREEALLEFKRGRMSILVATAVAARGLDIKNVAHVINFDLPKTIDGYVHRIGRTGRVGNRGKATSFFDSRSDIPLTGDLIKILRQAGQPVPDWLESTSGGGMRTFSDSRGSSRQFGGEDIRHINEGYNNTRNNTCNDTYNDIGRQAPLLPEPEEMW